ncbi:GNAT family N-acetyltransferase [Williamsia sp.]|uniref:GNAT family N-acetyltransferase n=1 Tax=Williamsia sp. TaxID=1872085 RepID=UPI001A272D79|nr:GNAT family N-acetyltransferase [Williamsia sp.]MBJ7291445.1 GNAT family N-acetyltransferase [Williamsia sp.]
MRSRPVSFYVGDGWLNYLRAVGDRRYSSVTASVPGGDLVSVSVWTPDGRTSPASGYRAATLTGRESALDEDFLYLGPHRGYENQMSLADADSTVDRTVAVESAIAAVTREASDRGLAGTIIPYLDTADAREIDDVVSGSSIPVLLDPTMTLDLPGDAFDDYLAGLGSKGSAKVRREIRKLASTGLQSDHESLAAVARELGPLVSNVQRRHGVDESPEDCVRGLEEQAAFCEQEAVVFSLRRPDDGTLVAASVYYLGVGSMHSRMVGIDYDLARNGEYFFANIYAPVRWAYENGFRRIELGRKSESTKRERGAHPRPQWSVVVPTVGVGPGSADTAKRNAQRLDLIRAELPTLAIEDVPHSWIEPAVV